jgi:hypothetical protein
MSWVAKAGLVLMLVNASGQAATLVQEAATALTPAKLRQILPTLSLQEQAFQTSKGMLIKGLSQEEGRAVWATVSALREAVTTNKVTVPALAQLASQQNFSGEELSTMALEGKLTTAWVQGQLKGGNNRLAEQTKAQESWNVGRLASTSELAEGQIDAGDISNEDGLAYFTTSFVADASPTHPKLAEWARGLIIDLEIAQAATKTVADAAIAGKIEAIKSDMQDAGRAVLAHKRDIDENGESDIVSGFNWVASWFALSKDPKNHFDKKKTTDFEVKLATTGLNYSDRPALRKGNRDINETVAKNRMAAFAPEMAAVLECKTGRADDGLPKFSNN